MNTIDMAEIFEDIVAKHTKRMAEQGYKYDSSMRLMDNRLAYAEMLMDRKVKGLAEKEYEAIEKGLDAIEKSRKERKRLAALNKPEIIDVFKLKATTQWVCDKCGFTNNDSINVPGNEWISFFCNECRHEAEQKFKPDVKLMVWDK